MELTDNPTLLAYWDDNTARIIKNLCAANTNRNNTTILDRIFRKGHNYESVNEILQGEKLTALSARLLEFKQFEKFKNIGLEDLEKLSVDERKEFLNGFISAISPGEISYRKQSGLKDMSFLQDKMKIFRQIDATSDETFKKSYQDIIDGILNSIPETERKIIDSAIDTKSYARNYRLKNPIPTLVDDIEAALPTNLQEINGRKIKVAKLDREPDIGIATHIIPNAEAISTIEALEITDPNMLLCVGTKGGNRDLNFEDDCYALALKPRKGTDWHLQATGDIDSGCNASKNIYNLENVILNESGNSQGCIDLIPKRIKKILNLSQKEYTLRMDKLKDCKTLQDIEKIDAEMASAIREVIKKQRLYEGLIRPETMGVLVSKNRALDTIDESILNYCERKNIPLIQVKPQAPKPKQEPCVFKISI